MFAIALCCLGFSELTCVILRGQAVLDFAQAPILLRAAFYMNGMCLMNKHQVYSFDFALKTYFRYTTTHVM